MLLKVSRNGEPIRNVPVKTSVDTGIAFSMSYAEFDAAVAAGASLEELYRWTTGGYPRSFKVKVLAWYNLHNAIEMHKADAAERAAQMRSHRPENRNR